MIENNATEKAVQCPISFCQMHVALLDTETVQTYSEDSVLTMLWCEDPKHPTSRNHMSLADWVRNRALEDALRASIAAGSFKSDRVDKKKNNNGYNVTNRNRKATFVHGHGLPGMHPATIKYCDKPTGTVASHCNGQPTGWFLTLTKCVGCCAEGCPRFSCRETTRMASG